MFPHLTSDVRYLMAKGNVNELFLEILDKRILKKAVFSKSEDKSVIRDTVSLKEKKGNVFASVERLTKDNKAFHRTLSPDTCVAVQELEKMINEDFRQLNIMTTAGDIEIKRSKSGTVHISGRLSDTSQKAEISSDTKRYILDASRDTAFLHELDITDQNGRVHDKKQAKFRQINRFLELVRDVEDRLPCDRPAVIYDLCCGKSYLTFAVYYYFTKIKGREVKMYGVDLKEDVIKYCNEVAKRVGFDNLSFTYGNINEYAPPEPPDMVISLHACDIATDIVLANAVKWGAGIILSTPCCHHEMSMQLSGGVGAASLRGELSVILEHPILRQKLCDAMTDALRAKRLESMGYSVTTLELIDPDETPKNLMIRAVRNRRLSKTFKDKALSEYRRVCQGLGIKPYLDLLICENEK